MILSWMHDEIVMSIMVAYKATNYLAIGMETFWKACSSLKYA